MSQVFVIKTDSYKEVRVIGTSIPIKGFEEFTFFVHHNVFPVDAKEEVFEENEDNWCVSELLTGAAITKDWMTTELAIRDTVDKLNKAGIKKFREMIAQKLVEIEAGQKMQNGNSLRSKIWQALDNSGYILLQEDLDNIITNFDLQGLKIVPKDAN